MTIDREQLIELLVNKTGLETEQVGEQLNNLITHIQKAAEQGESFEVEGLGTFKKEDDILHFDPDDTLQTEINHKYAGMKPIELIGAYQETPDVEIPEKDVKASEPVEPEPEKEPVRAEAAKFKLDEEALANEKESTDTQKPEIEEPKEPVEKSTEPISEKKPPASPEKKSAASSGKKESGDPIGRVLVAAVVVIAIGVSGWMIVDFGLFDGLFPGNNTTASETVQMADNNNAGENDREENQPAEQNDGNDVSTNENESVSEASRQSVYGLRGGATPEAPEGYTIVVHSLRSESKVSELEENYRSNGYITIMREASVGGQTYWRLGLGQFRTVEDALQAAEQLPEPEKSNHFIRKFQ